MRYVCLLFTFSMLLGTGCGQPVPARSSSTISPTPYATLIASGPTHRPAATTTSVASSVPDGLNVSAADTALDIPQLTSANAAPTARPTPAQATPVPGKPVQLEIASIQLQQPLVRVGLDQNNVPIVPKHVVGWYEFSAAPGQGENIVLWGHVLRFTDAPDIPAPFARLHEVGPGDSITLFTDDGAQFHYRVSAQIQATPDQVEYILPQGSEQVTLVSCIGDKVLVAGSLDMSHRLITIAEPAN